MPSFPKAPSAAFIRQLSHVTDVKTLARVLKELPQDSNEVVMNQLVDQFDAVTKTRQTEDAWLECFLRHAPIVWRGEGGNKIVSRTMSYALHHQSTRLLDALLERGWSDPIHRPFFEMHLITNFLHHLKHHPQWGQNMVHWFLVHPLMNQDKAIRPHAMLIDHITPRSNPSHSPPQVEVFWEVLKQTVRPEEVCHALLCTHWQQKSTPRPKEHGNDITDMWVNLSLAQSVSWTQKLAQVWDKTGPASQKAIEEMAPNWRPQWEKKLLESKVPAEAFKASPKKAKRKI